MERAQKKELPKINALLTSDWHARETSPICRTDNYIETLIRKMEFVKQLSSVEQVPVYHAGDLFDHWKPSPYLISLVYQHVPPMFLSVFGQHDLPQHNPDLSYKSGLGMLMNAHRIQCPEGWASWNQEPGEAPDWTFCVSDDDSLIEFRLPRKIMVMHRFVWRGKLPWPGCTAPTAREVLEQYPEYDLIVTGDNHKPFIERLDGRILVNPGSLMRMTADQEDFEPRIYAWNAELNDVYPIYIPIEKGVISREHIDNKEERDARIQAFVEKLVSEDWGSDISLEGGLERFITENSIPSSISEIIYRAIDKEE